MDRSTKERLTGAIVLVALAWLVIPVFLDGPETPPETVRDTVDLPGQDGQPTRTKTIVLNPRADDTVPAQEKKITNPPPVTRQLPATTPEPVERDTADKTPSAAVENTEETGREPEPKPEETPADTEATPPAADQSAPTKKAAESVAGALWAVQLGSFSSEENAERLAADLRKQGFAAFLSRVQTGGRQLHRVRVGPQGSRDEAESVASKLAAAGHKGQVVSHP